MVEQLQKFEFGFAIMDLKEKKGDLHSSSEVSRSTVTSGPGTSKILLRGNKEVEMVTNEISEATQR